MAVRDTGVSQSAIYNVNEPRTRGQQEAASKTTLPEFDPSVRNTQGKFWT